MPKMISLHQLILQDLIEYENAFFLTILSPILNPHLHCLHIKYNSLEYLLLSVEWY